MCWTKIFLKIYFKYIKNLPLILAPLLLPASLTFELILLAGERASSFIDDSVSSASLATLSALFLINVSSSSPCDYEKKKKRPIYKYYLIHFPIPSIKDAIIDAVFNLPINFMFMNVISIVTNIQIFPHLCTFVLTYQHFHFTGEISGSAFCTKQNL